MEEMMSLMEKPEGANEWFLKMRKEFEDLPEDS
jgi:hypothetical protein